MSSCCAASRSIVNRAKSEMRSCSIIERFDTTQNAEGSFVNGQRDEEISRTSNYGKLPLISLSTINWDNWWGCYWPCLLHSRWSIGAGKQFRQLIQAWKIQGSTYATFPCTEQSHCDWSFWNSLNAEIQKMQTSCIPLPLLLISPAMLSRTRK